MRRSARYFLTLAAALAAPLGLLAAVTPGAAAATGVTATFTKTQDWGTGYQATYTITNNTPADLSSWTITFSLPSGQQMGTYWDATETASSNPYTFVNRSYNGDVPANGGTASFGFIVSYSGTFAPPANCTVNGSPCGGGGGGGGISAPTGLAVTGTTSSSVSLSWQPVSNADNYLVLKNGTQAASTSSTSATVTGLAASTAYTFTVEAQDPAGDTSPQSGPVTATTQSGGGGGGGGTHLSVVNVMAMDYYGSWDSGGANMGSYAAEAAQDTLSFLQTVFPGATYAMVGVTPMIGQNDDPAEVFTESGAQNLVSFAKQNHLGRLAFWSVDRDQPCGGSASGLSQCSEISQQPLDFTNIFDQYTG